MNTNTMNTNTELVISQDHKWFYILMVLYIFIFIIILLFLYFSKSRKLSIPLKRFFLPSFGNVERMKAIGKYFDAIEGVLPKPGVVNVNSFDKLLNISQFTKKDSMNLIYLMFNTSRTPNQLGLGISSNDMNPWEDSFLHSVDPSLFTIRKTSDNNVKLIWRKDYRSYCNDKTQKCILGCGNNEEESTSNEGNKLTITGYRVYKYYPPLTTATLIEEKEDASSPFFTSTVFIDVGKENDSVCYYIRSLDQNKNELYYSNPYCIVPSKLLPLTGVVCASLTGIHNDEGENGGENINNEDVYINAYKADFYTATDDIKFYFTFSNKMNGCECGENENNEGVCYNSMRFYSDEATKDTITISDKSGTMTYYHYSLTKKRSELTDLELTNNNQIGYVYCPSQYNPVLSITPPDYRYAYAFPLWGVITAGINNRIQERTWFGYFMNLSHPIYIQKIKEFLSNSTKYGYNGVFIDMLQPYRVSLYSPWGRNAEAESIEYQDQKGFQDTTDLSKNLWTRDAIKLVENLQEWKKKTFPKFKIIGNSLPIATPDYNSCYFKSKVVNDLLLKICEPLDGALAEAIFPEGYGEPYWSECMRILDSVVDSGKILMLLYPGYNMSKFLTDPSKGVYRLFLIASSLMVDGNPKGISFIGNSSAKNNNSNIFAAYTATDMTLGPYADLQPEFNLPLGDAISNREWTGDVYIKKFQSGVVVVNSSKDDKYLQNKDIVKYGIRGRKNIVIGDIGKMNNSSNKNFLVNSTDKDSIPSQPLIGKLVSENIELESNGSILIPSLSAKIFI